MKLISLNTWGGKCFESLSNFIKQNSYSTDIFCLQEIYNTKSEIKKYKDIQANLLEELTKILPEFQYFYSIEIHGFEANSKIPQFVDFDLSVGKAIFVRKSIKVNSATDILMYGNRFEKSLNKDFSNLPVTFQSVELTLDKKRFVVVNIHGTPFPGTKLDTKLRLDHSKKIKSLLKQRGGEKIIVGDFNLLPKTESIRIFEDNMRNLIREFNIQRTRSKLSPFYGRADFQKFADFTFVTKDVKVKSFEVPRLNISDHLPMILEFS